MLSPKRRGTELSGLRLVASGKVREMYAVGEQLLMVASDRLSAFDVVLPNPIPGKGRVLNRLSLFWFEFLRDIVPNHLISADVEAYPDELRAYREQLRGRSMLVRRLEMAPVECVVRGFLAGSGWKDYQQTGAVCGIALPAGLRESERLPEPIFTPATKAQTGHDENIAFAAVVAAIGEAAAAELRAKSLAIYRQAAAYAESRGIILADTKFEFGRDPVGGEWILADEVLTPDSSRFWPAEGYQPGRPQPSFDKQFVRDYLETLNWNKRAPGPVLPADVVAGTRARYLAAYRMLTGRELPAD